MKTALITGASSGIGKATAEKLIEDGYEVYVAARRVEKMDELVKLGAIALKMDITKEEEVVNTVNAIAEKSGGIDVLVNNAGFGMYGAMEDTTIEDARYQFEVNLFGLARLTQLALPYMREHGAGRIVNISSMGGKIYTPLGSWYHATKHALEGWSDSLRFELAPFGIHVIVVEPGVIQTEFGDVLMDPMLERSGEGPYSKMAQSVAKATKASYESGGASPASLIANVISKSLKAKRPRTRYVAGKFAKPMLFIRKWFGDRAFDKALQSQF